MSTNLDKHMGRYTKRRPRVPDNDSKDTCPPVFTGAPSKRVA